MGCNFYEIVFHAPAINAGVIVDVPPVVGVGCGGASHHGTEYTNDLVAEECACG